MSCCQYRRVVTPQVVGALEPLFLRRRAQALADALNRIPGPRTVEFLIRRAGFLRWDVVAHHVMWVPVVTGAPSTTTKEASR